MAKELPYFQFEPSEWQNGDIQIASNEAKVAYIEICCTYWTRLGCLPYAFALQRHCNGNADLIQELVNCNAIKLEDENISISFLDEQLEEIEEKSNKARKSALKRWDNQKDNANAKRTHKKRNAIREDKIKEKEIKGDEENNSDLIRSIKEIEKDYLKNEGLIDAVLSARNCPFDNRSDLEKKLSEFCEHLRSIDETAKSEKDFKRHFLNWSRKKKDFAQKEKPKRHKLSMNDLQITKEDLEFKNLNQ